MQKKIFPFEMSQITLQPDLTLEPDYQLIKSIAPKKLTVNELIYLLQYKKFVDNPKNLSMCAPPEVKQMTELLSNVINRDVEGSIVETGVWRGGMGLWIKCLLKYYRQNRDIWLFDTFQYFPDPEHPKDCSIHAITKMLFGSMLSVDDIRNNFNEAGLLDDKVHLIKGLFEKTLPRINPGPIAILRLDSDYYDSTMFVLENYYKLISTGGYVVIDDYNNHYIACKEAVDDFRAKYSINNLIIDTHNGSVYWQI